ncbi:hypothetical protein BH23PLA1_BH23PLA1_29740 [soil metagenome]
MAKSRKNSDREQAPPEQTSAPEMAGDTTAANQDRDRLAARAYEIYQARGGGDGLAMDDWLEAEREAGEEPRGGNDGER